MTKLKFLLAFAVFAAACSSPSAQTTQNRDVTGFSTIDVSEGIAVTLTMGDKEKVVVSAPEDYIDQVITEVNGGELDIYIKGNNTGNKGRNIKVAITAKTITGVESSSGSSLKTTNAIKTEEFRVSVSSGANVNINCEAEKVDAKSSSGSGAKLSGSATYLSADASSGSHISASDLMAQQVIVDVSSGANIKVHAQKQINAEASSGGSISYYGSPELVDVDKSSGGSVRKQ